MTSTVRQRKAFAFSEDGENVEGENRILDEQEQEEIIDELRQAAKRSNDNLTMVITGILVIGIVSQLYFLSTTLRGSQLTPLSPLLDTFLEPKSLIPLASTLTVLHIGVLALDIISLFPTLSNVQKSIPADISRYAPLTACIAPIIAIISGRDVAQLAWWCVPAEITALVWVSRGWMAGAVEDITGLEQLRYDSKGA
ncbi:hypothetical protein FRC08_011823 [Ceratobasidium sp. 394]|nr:hypothetical protein FRC08_011823 [Ceratobasidium sp. 394]KAG9073726.1 hypothetical protein FS749_014738 [Ceratobasidium sp. UAMH 11750]